MSDHETISPEIDDELRARLQAFAEEVKERTDTEVALERMPRRSRPPTIRLVAIAACFILAVAVAAVVVADRQSVDTVPPAEAPDGPTTLARGVVQFEGGTFPPGGGCGVPAEGNANSRTNCLAGQTLDITAVEEDGEVTGEARFGGIVVELECVDTTAPDGVVALAGEVTESPGGSAPAVGALLAVIINEGNPDSATVWPDQHETCRELFLSFPRPWSDFLEGFLPVIYGFDIETGASDCSSTTQPRSITSGGQMKNRFAAPVASAATAMILLGACSDDSSASSDDGTTTSDDGPTTLANGEDINFVGGAPGLSDQTMDINAVEEDGEVTGEARFSPAELILDLQCADTDTDGLVMIGGQATADAGDGSAKGDRVAVIIRDGDPDEVILWFEQPLPEGEVAAGSCEEFLDAIPDEETLNDDEGGFSVIPDGDDIETG